MVVKMHMICRDSELFSWSKRINLVCKNIFQYLSQGLQNVWNSSYQWRSLCPLLIHLFIHSFIQPICPQQTYFCSCTHVLTFCTTSSLSRCSRSPFALDSSRFIRRPEISSVALWYFCRNMSSSFLSIVLWKKHDDIITWQIFLIMLAFSEEKTNKWHRLLELTQWAMGDLNEILGT